MWLALRREKWLGSFDPNLAQEISIGNPNLPFSVKSELINIAYRGGSAI
jgi:hypothetical protein